MILWSLMWCMLVLELAVVFDTFALFYLFIIIQHVLTLVMIYNHTFIVMIYYFDLARYQSLGSKTGQFWYQHCKSTYHLQGYPFFFYKTPANLKITENYIHYPIICIISFIWEILRLLPCMMFSTMPSTGGSGTRIWLTGMQQQLVSYECVCFFLFTSI